MAPSASALSSTRVHPCNPKTVTVVTAVPSYDSTTITGTHVSAGPIAIFVISTGASMTSGHLSHDIAAAPDKACENIVDTKNICTIHVDVVNVVAN